jgi:signal transduction histidine kinase
MAWGIGSIQTSDPQVRNVRNRLLGLYFGSMAVILGSFGIIVYRVVEYECNREVNSRLQQLAGSGTQTLAIIKHEYHELILKEKNQQRPSSQIDHSQSHLTLIDLIKRSDADSLPKRNSALEITSRSSFSNQNKLEWFDEDGNLMMLEGGLILQNSIPNSVEDSGMFSQHNMVRSYILPVYTFGVDANRKLIGYVRAGMSTAPLEEELQRLRWSFSLISITILGIITISSQWLMKESMKPILRSLEQLKLFTSDASHELRNPLTVIRASVSVMQNHPERIHPTDVSKLSAIASASGQMSALVGDLLLLARMDESLDTKQDWLMIDLNEMLEELLLLVESEAEQRKISLNSHLVPDSLIQGNSEELYRLFFNLVSNALHYTPEGGNITISTQKRSNSLVIQIKDTGIGIAAEHLPHIFDRFWRADLARQKQNGGSGLGLAIAQAIAHNHGGKITVISQLGSGSQFQVQFSISHV